MSTDTERAAIKLADLTRRWVLAERERKLRARERNQAIVLAVDAGCVLHRHGLDGESRRMYLDCPANTSAQLRARDLAHRTHSAYQRAVGVASGLRSAMTRSVKGAPIPNVEVETGMLLLNQRQKAREAALDVLPEFLQ